MDIDLSDANRLNPVMVSLAELAGVLKSITTSEKALFTFLIGCVGGWLAKTAYDKIVNHFRKSPSEVGSNPNKQADHYKRKDGPVGCPACRREIRLTKTIQDEEDGKIWRFHCKHCEKNWEMPELDVDSWRVEPKYAQRDQS